MKNYIEKIKNNQNLSFEESKALFNELMDGKYNENSIIEILESLSKKGETKDELAGGIFVLREKVTKRLFACVCPRKGTESQVAAELFIDAIHELGYANSKIMYKCMMCVI